MKKIIGFVVVIGFLIHNVIGFRVLASFWKSPFLRISPRFTAANGVTSPNLIVEEDAYTFKRISESGDGDRESSLSTASSAEAIPESNLTAVELHDYVFLTVSNRKEHITLEDVLKWEFVEAFLSRGTVTRGQVQKMFYKCARNHKLQRKSFQKFLDLICDVDDPPATTPSTTSSPVMSNEITNDIFDPDAAAAVQPLLSDERDEGQYSVISRDATSRSSLLHASDSDEGRQPSMKLSLVNLLRRSHRNMSPSDQPSQTISNGAATSIARQRNAIIKPRSPSTTAAISNCSQSNPGSSSANWRSLRTSDADGGKPQNRGIAAASLSPNTISPSQRRRGLLLFRNRRGQGSPASNPSGDQQRGDVNISADIPDSSDQAALLKSVFDDMAGTKGYCSVKNLLSWNFVSQLVAMNVLSEDDVVSKVSELANGEKGLVNEIQLDGFLNYMMQRLEQQEKKEAAQARRLPKDVMR